MTENTYCKIIYYKTEIGERELNIALNSEHERNDIKMSYDFFSKKCFLRYRLIVLLWWTQFFLFSTQNGSIITEGTIFRTYFKLRARYLKLHFKHI